MKPTTALAREEKRKTILVVDDDPNVIAIVCLLLNPGTFNVLTASSGADGLRQSGEYRSEIHLLVTNIQTPGMSGLDLATKMTVDRPNLRVLMMSGFPNGMLVLNEGWHFLQKPFVASQLRALVEGLVFPKQKSRFVN